MTSWHLSGAYSGSRWALHGALTVQEMVMAVWLIAKAFKPGAILAEHAGRTSKPRAAASGGTALEEAAVLRPRITVRALPARLGPH
jgi:hypothetical protein